MTTYYELLGISVTATKDEIKQAYHEQLQQCHPDKQGTFDAESDQRVSELNAAHKTLTDPALRTAYDKENNIHIFSPISSNTTSTPLFIEQLRTSIKPFLTSFIPDQSFSSKLYLKLFFTALVVLLCIIILAYLLS